MDWNGRRKGFSGLADLASAPASLWSPNGGAAGAGPPGPSAGADWGLTEGIGPPAPPRPRHGSRVRGGGKGAGPRLALTAAACVLSAVAGILAFMLLAGEPGLRPWPGAAAPDGGGGAATESGPGGVGSGGAEDGALRESSGDGFFGYEAFGWGGRRQTDGGDHAFPASGGDQQGNVVSGEGGGPDLGEGYAEGGPGPEEGGVAAAGEAEDGGLYRDRGFDHLLYPRPEGGAGLVQPPPPEEIPPYDPYAEGDGGDEFFVAGVKFRIPAPGPGPPLTEEELYWCVRERAWAWVVLEFWHPEEPPPYVAARLGFSDERCNFREPLPRRIRVKAQNMFGGIGIAAVAEALSFVRSWNPELVWLGPPFPFDVYDGTATPQAVAEAQLILFNLGYRPGPTDGVSGRRTAEALMHFQAAVGIPADGALDATTIALLRNALDLQGGVPVQFIF